MVNNSLDVAFVNSWQDNLHIKGVLLDKVADSILKVVGEDNGVIDVPEYCHLLL